MAINVKWWLVPCEERLEHYRRLICSGRTPILATLPLSGVYFVQQGTAVKIGKTVDLIRRYPGYTVHSPLPSKLIGFLPSTWSKAKLESEWKQRWAHVRLHGEWFQLTDELARAIKDAQQPLVLGDGGCPYVTVVEHVADMNRLVVWCPFCGNQHFHGAMGLPQGADITPALGSRSADCGGGTYILVGLTKDSKDRLTRKPGSAGPPAVPTASEASPTPAVIEPLPA